MKNNNKNMKAKSDTINIESINDLHKIPLQLLKSTKLYDFKGKYFEKLYQEALELEQKELEKQPMIRFVYSNISDQKNNFKKSKNCNKSKNKIDDNSNNMNNSEFDSSGIRSGKKKNSLEMKIINEDDNYKRKRNSNSCHESSRKNKELKIKKITFQIQYDTKIGEDIGLIGSTKEFGSWNQKNALRMHWNEGNIWKTTIDISFMEIKYFEYKFALFRKGILKEWENRVNRVFNLDDIQKLFENNKNDKGGNNLSNICKDFYEYNSKELSLIIKCLWNE